MRPCGRGGASCAPAMPGDNQPPNPRAQPGVLQPVLLRGKAALVPGSLLSAELGKALADQRRGNARPGSARLDCKVGPCKRYLGHCRCAERNSMV